MFPWVWSGSLSHGRLEVSVATRPIKRFAPVLRVAVSAESRPGLKRCASPLMNSGAIKTVEFDKILKALGSLTSTPLGLDRAQALRPSTDPAVVRESLRETTEACRFRSEAKEIPLAGTPEDAARLRRSRSGASNRPTAHAGRTVWRSHDRNVAAGRH